MNTKNTLLSISMVIAVFTNSIAIAGGPPNLDGLEECLAAAAIGLVGGGAGLVVGVQESKTILGKKNKKALGRLAKPIGGIVGAVGGAAAGAVVGYVGYMAIKAVCAKK
jgi:hypothetical protein